MVRTHDLTYNISIPKSPGFGRHQSRDSGLTKAAGIPGFGIPGLQSLFAHFCCLTVANATISATSYYHGGKNLVDALPIYAIVKIWISMFKFARAALLSLSGLRGVCLHLRLFQI